MEKLINTKFYTFRQNNSGGRFVESDKFGICENVIIEALDCFHAGVILDNIGSNVVDFYAYCTCCGRRWEDLEYLEDLYGYDDPEYNENTKWDRFNQRCFIHYLDGTKKEIKFKKDIK